MTDKPYATSFKYLTDLKDHIGKELGLTEWNQITQEKINTFAKLTGDAQWIHVNKEKSKKVKATVWFLDFSLCGGRSQEKSKEMYCSLIFLLGNLSR